MLTATNICLPIAKEIKQIEDNTAYISINSTVTPLEELNISREHPKVLTVRFDDVVINLKHCDVNYKVINNLTAKLIVEFIERNRSNNFIVHCMAGVSRSAAVCMFINYVYGHKLKDDFWILSHPNVFVLGKLLVMHEFIKFNRRNIT